MAGRRVGLSGSTVGLVVGSGIAKAIEELGAVAGACVKSVPGALRRSVVGVGFCNRTGGTYIQYNTLICCHGPTTGHSGPFRASNFVLLQLNQQPSDF